MVRERKEVRVGPSWEPICDVKKMTERELSDSNTIPGESSSTWKGLNEHGWEESEAYDS